VIPGLAEAEQAGLVRWADGRVCFTDPRYAPAVYAAADAGQRRAAHGRLARVLPEGEERARHLALAAAGADPAVAEVAERAARQAEGRGAGAVAADLWTLASRRTPAGDVRWAGRMVAAARCLLRCGDCAGARGLLEQVVSAVPAGPDRAHALLWLATVTFHERGGRAAVPMLRDALPMVPDDLRMAWSAEHDLLYTHAAVEDSWEMSATVDPYGARVAWRSRLSRARQTGDEAAVPQLLYHLAQVECWLGGWRTAQHHVEDLIEAVEQTGQRRLRSRSLHLRALVAAYRGDTGSADAAIGEGLSLAEEFDDRVARALHLGVRGFLDLSRGDAHAADRHLVRAAALLDASGMRGPDGFAIAADRIEAALATGAVRRGADLVAAVRSRAHVSAHPWLRAIAARGAAQVAMAAGDLPAAQAAIDEAYTAHRALPVPFELARTRLVHGQILRRMRRRGAAEQTLRQAQCAFAESGATLWVSRACAQLHRAGLHRVAEGALTPAESQVARLVAAGHSNGEVAATLVLSRRTVENHLCRIYRKLGVGARTDLPAALNRVRTKA
jgi:DNA-binding CsgD family transcriptional regulator